MLLVAAGSLAEQQTEEENKRKIITDWFFTCTPPHVCVTAPTDPHVKFGAGCGVEKRNLETDRRKEGDFALIFIHGI